MSVATKPSARTISTTDQLPDSATLTCATRGSRARAAASIAWHSSTFLAKGIADSGSSAPYIARLVRGGGGGRRALGRIEQLQRLRGAFDRGGADLIGMGEGGRFAGDAAQAEARAGVIIGGLQPAVVEAERLVTSILEVELAIVVRGEMPRGERGRLGGIERAIEKVARVGCHEPGAMVGGSAFKHEAAVAIAAVDEADLVVDLIIDARMAERGIDLAGAVASDAMMLGANNFRGRLHGPYALATASRRFNKSGVVSSGQSLLIFGGQRRNRPRRDRSAGWRRWRRCRRRQLERRRSGSMVRVVQASRSSTSC